MKICAVVVTYNRKKLLAECLQALLNQTYTLDEIFVIDNASTDGTDQMMREKFPQITYIKLKENIGGAGGFHEGMRIAYNKGYDWIWVMDDDAEPYINALERLINSNVIYNHEVGAIMNLITDENDEPEERSLESIIRIEKIFKKRQLQKNDFYNTNNFLQVSSYPLLGIFISKNVIKKIGLPNSKFFIQCDDVEYTLRISDVYKMYIILDSKILHKNQNKILNNKKNIFGKKIRRLALNQLWKDYYGVRNYIYLINSRLSFLSFLNYLINSFLLDKILGGILFDDNKLLRLKIYFRALNHGIRKKIGKLYLPNSFKNEN